LYGDWRAFHVSRIEDKRAQSCKRLVTMGVPDEAPDDRGYEQVRHRSPIPVQMTLLTVAP